MTAQNDPQNRGYAKPDVLVSTEWMSQHLDDDSIRLVESDEDILLYEIGHVPGAVKVDWHTDLQDTLIRDFVDQEQFAALMSRLGIANDTTVVFYGDKNNWWAAYAYWFFTYMGHDNLKIMDGGRKKWEAEGRPLTREVPQYPATDYTPQGVRHELRAFQNDALGHAGYEGRTRVSDPKPMVDVRSPAEYTGEKLHMEEYPQEGSLRGGHIAGAANIPWGKAVNDEDGTFKSAEELTALYSAEGLKPDDDIIVYCRIGERSSHSWFVLRELLGYERVRNYDGSWTEWGNVVGLPIER